MKKHQNKRIWFTMPKSIKDLFEFGFVSKEEPIFKIGYAWIILFVSYIGYLLVF